MNPYIGKETIFCDIDGTVVIQPHGPEGFNLDAEATIFAVETVNKWKDEGHCVVFTTARDDIFWTETKEQLDKLGFKYDKLITGIGSGKRWVVNNTKSHTQDTAGGIVVGKNLGMYAGNVIGTQELIV